VHDSPNRSFADLTLRDFVDLLASTDPVPGGGSASAVAASLGAALLAMVAGLSKGRPRYAEHSTLHAELRARGATLADALLRLADADSDAYAGYVAAARRAREQGIDAAGDPELQRAAREAAQVPLDTVEACHAVVVAAEALAGRSNRNAASDLNVAATLAAAAARGAAANVIVNLPALREDDPFVAEATARVGVRLAEIERLAQHTADVVESGEAREPLTATPAGSPG
jgi:formiminotetrahydrofolate cyclodeaminase